MFQSTLIQQRHVAVTCIQTSSQPLRDQMSGQQQTPNSPPSTATACAARACSCSAWRPPARVSPHASPLFHAFSAATVAGSSSLPRIVCGYIALRVQRPLPDGVHVQRPQGKFVQVMRASCACLRTVPSAWSRQRRPDPQEPGQRHATTFSKKCGM